MNYDHADAPPQCEQKEALCTDLSPEIVDKVREKPMEDQRKYYYEDRLAKIKKELEDNLESAVQSSVKKFGRIFSKNPLKRWFWDFYYKMK